MSHESDQEKPLPIACTLTPAELAAGRDTLLPGLLAKAEAKEPIPGGIRFRFAATPDRAREIAAVIDAEHQCCRFLRFVLGVEPGDGPIWLEVTGPEGSEDFLTSLLDAPASGA